MNKLFAFILTAVAFGPAMADVSLPSGVVKPKYFDVRGIKVIGYQKGAGNLNVWTVERQGVKTVFYTTPDNKVLISGVMWDANSGANVSDIYIAPVAAAGIAGIKPANTVTDVPPSIAPVVKNSLDTKQFSASKIPDAIKGIATLGGVKEGTAAVDKTLYVMFDPRCPHCHAVYQKTRQWVAKGGSIKWVPISVINSQYNGPSLIADIMEASNQSLAMAEIMSGKKQIGTRKPSKATDQLINENQSYFFAAFDRNKAAGEAGVPVAFFADKNGVPQMVGGIDDDQMLKQILNDIKK